jgi:hypothetical protein
MAVEGESYRLNRRYGLYDFSRLHAVSGVGGTSPTSYGLIKKVMAQKLYGAAIFFMRRNNILKLHKMKHGLTNPQ